MVYYSVAKVVFAFELHCGGSHVHQENPSVRCVVRRTGWRVGDLRSHPSQQDAYVRSGREHVYVHFVQCVRCISACAFDSFASCATESIDFSDHDGSHHRHVDGWNVHHHAHEVFV